MKGVPYFQAEMQYALFSPADALAIGKSKKTAESSGFRLDFFVSEVKV
jgi:hypothetical protein